MRKNQKTAALAAVNLLDLRPRRRAAWVQLETRVIVERPRPATRSLRSLFSWITYGLSSRRIRLDEVGSFAWQQLDGQQTVAEVAEKLRREFGARVEPTEERLGQLVRLLRQEQLLAYPGWDDDPSRARSSS